MAVGQRPLLVALRPLGLGDLLTGVPALRALAAAFPEHERVLAAPRELAPLALLSGAIDRVVDAKPLVPLPRQLDRPDVAVDLHGRGPASHRVLLSARPRRLVAFANPDIPESRGMPEWRADEHEVGRWCRLLAELGIAADSDALDLPAPQAAVPSIAIGATVVHPGAASGARRWPPERFAAVARAELESGRRVVVTGSSEERELARWVGRRAGAAPAAVLAGRTDLLALAATVAAAGRVVCGDTGVAHLATALGTPSVVVFGPTSPHEWGPPPQRPQHRVLWRGTTGDSHGETPDAGLLAVGVDDVLAELGLLDGERVAA